MITRIRMAAGAFITSAALLTAVPAASAQTVVIPNGLVNVVVGDVTIAEDVNVAVAAQIVANLCGLKVGPVAVLGTAVDRSGASNTVCTTGDDDDAVTITQS